MDIVYVGQLWPGGTSSMRMAALRELGLRVRSLDVTDEPPRDALITVKRRLLFRLGWPTDGAHINERLVDMLEAAPADVLWIDKGLVISDATLQRIKARHPSTRLIHYNPDDPFGAYGLAGWRTFIRAIPHYDAHLVPRRVNIEEYRRTGARRVIHSMPAWGFSPDLHAPLDPGADACRRYGADLGFIGSFESDRAAVLLQAARAGLQLRIVGPWPKDSLDERMLHTPAPAFGMEYVKALRCLKIALGFLRKSNRDQHTSRSVEIPACGVFMLAERSDEHRELFEEGIEAEFFTGTDELIDKARFYLAHDALRERIAAAGRARCLRSGYSNRDCMHRMIHSALN